MSVEQWYLVLVFVDGELVETRVAPESLASSYEEVFRQRFRHGQVWKRPATPDEIAYPRRKPYDPTD